MIAKIASPSSALVLALLLAIAAGPAWFFVKTAAPLAAAVAARRAQQQTAAEAVTERKAQGWDFWTLEMESLANELKDEKAQLRQRSDLLDQRAARLTADRQELDRIRSEIEGMRRDLDARVIAIKSDEAKNLRSLALTYSTLTPEGAVAIIREMDDPTVVKILSLMKADQTGAIFEQMAKTPDVSTGAAAGATLAKRAALLMDKIRLMKVGIVPATR